MVIEMAFTEAHEEVQAGQDDSKEWRGGPVRSR